MKKGIILEMDKRYVTLLTPDGQFLRADNHANAYHIGQEITFLPIEEKATKSIFLTRLYQDMKGKVAICAMVMLVVLASTMIPMYQRNQVYAYMSIDQAGIELAVNNQLEIIEITPYSQKGDVVLRSIDTWEKEDLASVSKNILFVIDKKDLSDQEEIVLSTVYNGKRNDQTDNNLQKEIAELKQYVAANDKKILHVKANKEERKEALERGISVGELKREAKQKTRSESKTNLKQKDQKNPPAEQPKKNQQFVPSESSTNQNQPKVPNKQKYKDERKAPELNDQPKQQKEQNLEKLEKQKDKSMLDNQVSKQNKKMQNQNKTKEKNK